MIIKNVVTWEEEDIKIGRYVIRQSSPLGSNNISFATSVTYKIGFLTNGGNSMCLISICDGMVIEKGTKIEMADSFNNDKDGYRPLTQKDLIAQINYLEKQNCGVI